MSVNTLHFASVDDFSNVILLLQVRPEEVLEKALNMVQSSPKNYLYKCDQLKSIRQDLTVQRIRNELTVKVFSLC